MMECIYTENKNRINIAIYHLNRFLSASALSSLSPLIFFLQKTLLDDLTLNVGAKSASYHLNKFLSASTWCSLSTLVNFGRKLCLMIVLLIFKESSFQVSLTILLTSICILISISEFVIPLYCKLSVVQSCTCKEYIKHIILSYLPILRSNLLHQL